MCGCHFSAAFKDCPGCIRAAGPARRGRPPKHTCGSGGAPRSLPLPNDGPVAPVGRKIRSCYAHECLLGRVSARGCGKWLNDVESGLQFGNRIWQSQHPFVLRTWPYDWLIFVQFTEQILGPF